MVRGEYGHPTPPPTTAAVANAENINQKPGYPTIKNERSYDAHHMRKLIWKIIKQKN